MVTPEDARTFERCMRALSFGSTSRVGFRHPAKAEAIIPSSAGPAPRSTVRASAAASRSRARCSAANAAASVSSTTATYDVVSTRMEYADPATGRKSFLRVSRCSPRR